MNANFHDPPCGYYCLKPRWVSENEKLQTRYPVIFFLNPMRQREHDYGWFTVEELEQWTEGRGPVMKQTPPGS